MAFDDQDQQVDLDAWEKRVFEKHGVPEGLRMSIRKQESGGDVNATSPTGVKGRYQVTQKTAANFGLNRDDPWEQPVAAARLLRQGYDDAKRKNPKFSDRQAWLASSASYYAGPDAFDASGNLSTGSKDSLSNPSRYAESIAQKWANFEKGQSAQTPINRPSELDPQPSTLRKAIVPGRQQTTVRGPVRPARPDPFGLTAPDIAGDAAAIASRISPEVGVEADRRGRELTRFQGRSRLGQLGEVAAGGLMQGVDQMVKAANTINPYMSPQMSMAQRRQGMMTPDAQQNLQRQQAAQDVALPNTAPIVRGTVAAGSQLPAIALAGPAAPLVAGGLAASNADWRDPKRAALQTAIGLAGGAAGGKLAQMAIRPATMGGRLASGAAGGAAGNVIPLAGEQLAYEGRLNPQQLAQQAVIGAATGAALPPGADPRSRVRQVRPESPIDVPVYDDTGEITGYDRINAPLTPDVVGQGVNRAGDLGATVQRAGDIRPRPRGTAPMPIQNRIEQQRPPILARQTQAMPIQAPEPVRPLAILQENANEAKINAAQFEQSGDWESAQREYDVAHKTLVEAQRQMRRVRNQTPEQADALSAIAREISGAALNRNRASRSATVARREQGIAGRQARKAQDVIENALTADLPAETNPLLKSVVNPESGIPAAEESASGIFGQLARQRAAEQAKPQRGPKDSGQLSAAEYLKRASNGEGIRVSDRGEARVLGAKEAGIVGLTNRASKYAVSDAQVMLDEGGFSLQDGRRFTDSSVTENDVLAFLAESGREGRMNTRDLDQRIEREAAEYYENQPTGEVRPASNRLPRISDLPPSRMSRPLEPIPRGTESDRPLTVREQARKAGGVTGDLEVMDRLARRQGVERPRDYAERTSYGEPGSGASLSQYTDMMRGNRAAFDQLRQMNVDSVEAGEIIARIEDYNERHAVAPHHLENELNTIRGEQAGTARRADLGIGSAPLRDPSTAELRDFYSRPDETRAPSAPLRPVRREAAQVQQPEPVAKTPRVTVPERVSSNVDDTIAGDLRRLHAMNPQEIEQAIRSAEARRNEDIRDPQMNAVERRQNRDLLKFANERRHEMVLAKELPAKSPRGPARGERPTAKEAAAPNPLEQDVTILDDGDLAKRIRDAETILNRAPDLNPARRKKVEEFLNRAKQEQGKRTPTTSPETSRTVSHPDPAIDGQLVLATTADGRVIVANEGNKSGVSVVKDRLTTEPKPDRAPVKYAIPDEAMPELNPNRERGDVFYSQLERVIDQKMSAKASAAQVRAMVENPQSGVKVDEIKWTGLDDFLRSKGEVTKAEVQEFLKANQVEVREVEKGRSAPATKDEIAKADAALQVAQKNLADFERRFDRGEILRSDASSDENTRLQNEVYIAEDIKSDLEDRGKADTSKFSNYTLPGAKEGSYRELLLTMPNKAPETLTELPDGYVVGHDPMASMERRYHILPPGQSSARPFYGKHASPEAAKAAALEHLNTSRAQNKDVGGHKSPHFDEPNILAHLRFNERTDADGNRVMHLEEIQSDWHQEGRKKGYASDGELFRVRKESDGDAYEIYDVKTGDVVGDKWAYEDQAIKEAQRFTREDRASSVPDAPFKKTWHELAFKRALRYAAENGYDKMTWTTGEQQAERFDLSKYIDDLYYSTDSETGRSVVTGYKNGQRVVTKETTDSGLPDVIGKEAAEKILSQPTRKSTQYSGDNYSERQLSGLDLKVGGEGMKGFYDQILPAFANKYAKKWGARVGEAKIDVSSNNTSPIPREPILAIAHSIDITPAMRESVVGGQPMFQRGNQPSPMPDRVTARDLADNIRAEYRPAANRPGTVYLNDWGLEALNAADYIEFRSKRPGAADDRITGGVNYPPEEARQIADHIRERAGRPNFSENGRKNSETMARQIELAADDGNVSFVPMQGQAMRQARQTIRHEAFHSQQSAVHPDVHELTPPRWLRAQRFGAAIGEELSRRGYSERQHPAEAAAFVASGNWDAFGMNRDDAREFLTEYFDNVAYRHGKEAINKFRAIHPALQEVVEARRGTNEPRFGGPGLGRSIGSAVNRQRGVERPGGGVARSRGSVPGGEAGSVRGQSQTAALRAITPASLRAGQQAQPSAAQGQQRQGLAGIRAEDLRAPGAPPPPTPRPPREPISGVPTGKDVSGFDYLRSRLSNLNFTGTYERLAGARGREASEIIRNAQVEIARQPDTERASLVSGLRRQLQPFKAEFRDNGQPGLANWMDEHVNAINDADAAFKGLAGFLRGFHYNTKLRYNPKSAALNSLQPLQTLWPHVTTREFAKLMKDARTPLIRGRVLEIAERESGGQVEEVSKRGRFEAVPKVLRNPFAVVSDTNRVVGHLAGEMFADRMGLTGHAKARMAADWAKKIEYDNSRWDVPPLFSGRLAGVVGQFKSFTVKNLERLHADWKAAPEGSGTGNLARRAKMITGQVVLGGVRSIPGVKQIGGVLVLGALARAFSDVGLDEDDANKAAEAVYFGAPGLIEQDISSSMMILDAPFGNTPAEQAVNYLGGPTLSLIVKAFKEGETMIDAEGGRGSTAADKRKAAGIRLAKAVTPYSKTVEAAADLAQGKRPALKLERKSVPMTNLEVAGKLGMATPLRQSKFYEEKEAYDWQKRVARKLKPAQP